MPAWTAHFHEHRVMDIKDGIAETEEEAIAYANKINAENDGIFGGVEKQYTEVKKIAKHEMTVFVYDGPLDQYANTAPDDRIVIRKIKYSEGDNIADIIRETCGDDWGGVWCKGWWPRTSAGGEKSAQIEARASLWQRQKHMIMLTEHEVANGLNPLVIEVEPGEIAMNVEHIPDKQVIITRQLVESSPGEAVEHMDDEVVLDQNGDRWRVDFWHHPDTLETLKRIAKRDGKTIPVVW